MSEQGYLLRELDTCDLDALLELEYLIFPLSWSKEQYAGLLRTGGCKIFGAFRAGRLWGYTSVQIVPAAGEMEVHNLAVCPEARGRQLGVSLMKLALDLAKKSGMVRAVLEVRVGNAQALGLYERMGFVRCGARRAYYANPTEDALILEYRFG